MFIAAKNKESTARVPNEQKGMGREERGDSKKLEGDGCQRKEIGEKQDNKNILLSGRSRGVLRKTVWLEAVDVGTKGCQAEMPEGKFLGA
jgi:hypothetical protein